jgi:hypothetical protein
MTEESEMSKYIVYGLDGDPGTVVMGVCPNNTDMGPFLVSLVGADYPFFAFESLPSAILLADEIGADFNTAPLCSSDYQTNRNSVTALYASPPQVGEIEGGGNVVWVVG